MFPPPLFLDLSLTLACCEMSMQKKGKECLRRLLPAAAWLVAMTAFAELQPVPLDRVWVDPSHLVGGRLEKHRTVTLPSMLDQLEERGLIANFVRAAGGKDNHYDPRAYGDAYVYCALEGGGHVLRYEADDRLRFHLQQVLQSVLPAQERDGYIYTSRTIGKNNRAQGYERWKNELGGQTGHDSHETYNHGHFIESAIALHEAGISPDPLPAARKAADLIASIWRPGRLTIPPGHPGIEVALIRLYEETGDPSYLETAYFMMECRGRGNHRIARHRDHDYYANHAPVTRQREPAGHAVRAVYLYHGMTEYARISGNAAYADSVRTLWRNMVLHKMYLTGGIGTVKRTEGFGPDYDLPLESYAETCAAIASVQWNLSLFLLDADAKYIDILERVLYNAVFGGLSLDGKRFFYQNPIEAMRRGESRYAWHHTPCCLGNLVRFLPQIPGLCYAKDETGVYVNLFVPGQVEAHVGHLTVKLRMWTEYPWDGSMRLMVGLEDPAIFALRIRLPGWVRGNPVPGDLYRYIERDRTSYAPAVTVNGQPVEWREEKGYMVVNRTWSDRDVVEWRFPMEPRRVVANDQVASVRNRVAVERGPLVYCLESIDNSAKNMRRPLADDTGLTVMDDGTIRRIRTDEPEDERREMIPYFLWDNRGPSTMRVWLPR